MHRMAARAANSIRPALGNARTITRPRVVGVVILEQIGHVAVRISCYINWHIIPMVSMKYSHANGLWQGCKMTIV